MKILKFLATNKVLEYLENEVHNAANSLGIFQIDAQVWENENTPREGYLGYAMQEEMDYKINFDDFMELNEESDTRILVHEFRELLDQIWYSIGLTQLHTAVNDDSLFAEENKNFRIHFNSTIILTSIASDRIKDFVATVILKKQCNPNKIYYTQLFREL